MSRGRAQSVFALGAFAVAWVAALVSTWLKGPDSGMVVMLGTLASAFALEQILFYRGREEVEQRGFPIEPIVEQPPPAVREVQTATSTGSAAPRVRP